MGDLRGVPSMPRNLEKVQKYHQPAKWAIIFRANLFILLLQVCYIFGSPPDLYLRTFSVSTLLLFVPTKTGTVWLRQYFSNEYLRQLKDYKPSELRTKSNIATRNSFFLHYSAFFSHHYRSIWSLPGKIYF
jgi:hypothetical protein